MYIVEWQYGHDRNANNTRQMKFHGYCSAEQHYEILCRNHAVSWCRLLEKDGREARHSDTE